MSTYETITIDQLTNRAHTAYQRGCMGKPETPDTFFAVQYWAEEKECWWTFAEATDQEEAEREFAKWANLRGSAEGMRILHVVAQKSTEVTEVEKLAKEIVGQEEEESTSELQGIVKYDDEFFDLIESVRATARNAEGTFTADEMLQALVRAADPKKDNFNLNARRVNAALVTLSNFELTEVAEYVYRMAEVK